MLKQDWEWTDEYGGTSGVHSHEGQLVWWSRPSGPNGRFGEAATTQSFENFRQNGPKVSGAPDSVLNELFAIFGKSA